MVLELKVPSGGPQVRAARVFELRSELCQLGSARFGTLKPET
jgi:hypothetical protein